MPHSIQDSYQPVDVETELWFLQPEQKHKTEKPYKLRYDPGDELPRSNCNNELTKGVPILDFRGREKEFTVEKQGFTIDHLESKLTPEEFNDDDKVKEVYYTELIELLKARFGAKRVEVLEHGVRKRHVEFPVSTGADYEFRQPASVVHLDFTPDAVIKSSELLLHVDATKYERVRCINIWKPLYGPVTDWPLGLCDVQSINAARDLVGTDVVFRDSFTENYSVYANPNQKWYYLNNQRSNEVLLFRQTDTDERFATGVPHASFHNPKSLSTERPRESIEARAFLYY